MPIGVVPIEDVMRRCTLGWHGQVECKLDADWCGANWGCDEKVHTGVAWTGRMQA